VSRNARPTFEFASEPRARFECWVDAAPKTPCTSPHTTATLHGGAHHFRVRAIDAAGNVGSAVQSGEFTVDTIAPAAPTITASITGGDASFVVSAESGATLQCSMDSGPWTACVLTYSGFAPGPHVFQVRATDAAGNVGSAAHHSWTVEAALPPITPPAIFEPRPVISFTAPRQRLATVLRSGLSIRLGCSPACRTRVVVKHGRSTAANRTVTGGASRTVRIRLTAATRRKLAKARRATLTVSVSAAGAQTVTRKVTIKR
jgi:hypothetical protein